MEKISKFTSPKLNLEQYQTPASIAATICHIAYMKGDTYMKTILDLGCGTGILAIGASLLGANIVYGIDIDNKSIEIANKNGALLNRNIKFLCMDILNLNETKFSNINTVIMNPPFGSRKKGADRPFLLKALELANVIYTIHNKDSYKFVKSYIYPSIISDSFCCKFPIYRTFSFHKKDIYFLEVEIYRIEKINFNEKKRIQVNN